MKKKPVYGRYSSRRKEAKERKKFKTCSDFCRRLGINYQTKYVLFDDATQRYLGEHTKQKRGFFIETPDGTRYKTVKDKDDANSGSTCVNTIVNLLFKIRKTGQWRLVKK
jgi:hypothetical protein